MKKKIYIISLLSSLNLISGYNIGAEEVKTNKPNMAAEKANTNKPNMAAEKANTDKNLMAEAKSSTNINEKKTESKSKVENSFMSTIKKHKVVYALVPVAVLSAAIVGGKFVFFKGGDKPGGQQHPKAQATIDAMNKLNTEGKDIKKFISDLGDLGDGTVRVVVSWMPSELFEDWCSRVTANDIFCDTIMILTTIINDALKTPNADKSSTSIFKYEDRKQNLTLPKFNKFAWLRLLRDVPLGDKKYSIWFGMDKNNEDLHINIDLTMGW